MHNLENEDEEEANIAFLKSWKSVYKGLVLYIIVLIILFYMITLYFR